MSDVVVVPHLVVFVALVRFVLVCVQVVDKKGVEERQEQSQGRGDNDGWDRLGKRRGASHPLGLLSICARNLSRTQQTSWV